MSEGSTEGDWAFGVDSPIIGDDVIRILGDNFINIDKDGIWADLNYEYFFGKYIDER